MGKLDNISNGLLSNRGAKDVKINFRLSVPDYADLKYVAKRFGIPFDEFGNFDQTQTLTACIRFVKKELTEPTIKFEDDKF